MAAIEEEGAVAFDTAAALFKAACKAAASVGSETFGSAAVPVARLASSAARAAVQAGSTS